MKPASLLLFAVTSLVAWGVRAAEAVTLSVDAVLDHPNLSDGNPINWSVMFPPIFFTIETVRVDSYLVGDGLDVGEVIIFEGLTSTGGVGFIGLGQEIFFRSFSLIPGHGIDHFLDGSGQGRILAGFPGSPPPEVVTTATFERLVLTFEGEGTELPEPGSLLLVATGLVAGARKLRGVTRP